MTRPIDDTVLYVVMSPEGRLLMTAPMSTLISVFQFTEGMIARVLDEADESAEVPCRIHFNRRAPLGVRFVDIMLEG
jgi:hypothetical protein